MPEQQSPERYSSMHEVPPHLGTVSDYRIAGRKVKDDAQPRAVVSTPGDSRTPLYTHGDTVAILGIPAEALQRWKDSRRCRHCGRFDSNRLKKVLELNEDGLCRACRADAVRINPSGLCG